MSTSAFDNSVDEYQPIYQNIASIAFFQIIDQDGNFLCGATHEDSAGSIPRSSNDIVDGFIAGYNSDYSVIRTANPVSPEHPNSLPGPPNEYFGQALAVSFDGPSDTIRFKFKRNDTGELLDVTVSSPLNRNSPSDPISYENSIVLEANESYGNYGQAFGASPEPVIFKVDLLQNHP